MLNEIDANQDLQANKVIIAGYLVPVRTKYAYQFQTKIGKHTSNSFKSCHQIIWVG